MTNRDIENALNTIESLLELHGENGFKSRAYGRAGRAIRASGIDVAEKVEAGEPLEIDGIGKGLEAEIAEIVQRGSSTQLDQLLHQTPNGLLDILEIRGLGAKKVRALWKELGIDALDVLEAKARSNEIAALKGFGKKSQENILDGIAEVKSRIGKMRLHTATVIADEIVTALRGSALVERVEIAGRLRRGGEEFGAIELVVALKVEGDAGGLATEMEAGETLSDLAVRDGVIRGKYDGLYTVLIHTTSVAQFPVALHQKSGASDYRFMVSIPLHDRGYELTDDALLKEGKPVTLSSEDELFALAGMDVIPPELREGIDEVRAALDHRIPTLVEGSELRGLLHIHSVWSDGQNTIEELAAAASGLGYGYLLMCDHSKLAFYANGLDEKRLEAQGKEIDEINKRYDPATFRILKGIECDIHGDGTLDLADDALAALDAVVVSVHSQFALEKEAQTDRVCRALDNPYASILAHPTGRLILTRKGYPIDLKRVITHAAERGVAVELNANPHRLDLDWRMVRYAKRKGVKVAIDPDAHSIGDFDYVKYGVRMGRKGWLERGDVLNTLSVDDFLAAVGRRRTTPATS